MKKFKCFIKLFPVFSLFPYKIQPTNCKFPLTGFFEAFYGFPFFFGVFYLVILRKSFLKIINLLFYQAFAVLELSLFFLFPTIFQ